MLTAEHQVLEFARPALAVVHVATGAAISAQTEPSASDLRAPVPFSPEWLITGAVLLVLAVVILVRVLRRPRPRTAAGSTAPAAAGAVGARPEVEQRRAEALARLDDVEREVRAGRLSPRDVGHRTAELLRLADTPATPAALAACRPWQFQPRPPTDPEPLLRIARAALQAPAGAPEPAPRTAGGGAP